MNFFILIFIVFHAFAYEEESCDTSSPISKDVTSFAKSVSLPNCYTKSKLNAAMKGKTKPLCLDCKNDFQKKYTESVPSLPKEEIQKKYFETIFKQYKKALTDNLVEVAKLRSLHKTNAKLDKSIKACQMHPVNDFLEGCASETAKKFIKNSNEFSDLSKNMANELAHIISTTPLQPDNNSLLNRMSAKNLCSVPEKDLLQARNSTLEESFTSENVEMISSLDAKNFSSIDDLFSSNSIDERTKSLLDAIKSHPLLSSYTSSPAAFIKLMKSIPRPVSAESFQKRLYSAEIATNFDSSLATNCSESFNTVKDSLCSNDFEQGNINLEPFNNIKLLSKNGGIASANELADSEDLLNQNLDLFKFCELKTTNSKVNLTQQISTINSRIGGTYSELTLSQYASNKYDNDFNSGFSILCGKESEACPQGKSDPSFNCRMYQKYKSIKDPNSIDHKLANSSNDDINVLLRSMIGSANNIPPETRRVLISQGILPKEDGKYVPQPRVAERESGLFNQSSSQNQSASRFYPTSTAASAVRPAVQDNTQMAAPAVYPTSPSTATVAASESSAPARDVGATEAMKEMKKLSQIQQNILNRLKPDPTPQEVRQAAYDALKDTKKDSPILASEVDQTAADFTKNVMPAYLPSSGQGLDQKDKSTLDRGISAAEKLHKDNTLVALSGMGSRENEVKIQKAAESTSVKVQAPASEEDITKVDINMSQDKLDKLSDILKAKVQKDAEGQRLAELVKKKENFILNINGLSLMIEFDKKVKEGFVIKRIGAAKNPSESDKILTDLKAFITQFTT